MFASDRTWNDLGLTQYVAKDYKNAAANFNKAARLAPANGEPQMNLGLIEMLNKNYSKANQFFGSAAGVSELNEALGVYYLKQGDNAAAARAFGDSKSNNAALAQILTIIEVCSSVFIILGYILCQAEVVPGAVVFRIQLCGLFVDGHTSCIIVGEGSCVKNFVYFESRENREKNTDSYLRGQLKKDKITEFGELTSQFTAEDWEGFQELVSKSNIQDKELILSVLSMYKDPEEREREIRNLSNVFEQLADNILPQLRYSFFELATQVAVGVFLAVFGEATVDVVAAVGRCVGGNVDFFDFAVCGGVAYSNSLPTTSSPNCAIHASLQA